MLRGRRWCLQAIVLDGERIAGVENAGAYIVLGNDDRAYGRGGCNRFFGKYSLDGSEIRFGPLGSTLMYCEGSMHVESAFFQALDMVSRAEEGGETLTMLAPDGSAVLTSEAEKEDAPETAADAPRRSGLE